MQHYLTGIIDEDSSPLATGEANQHKESYATYTLHISCGLFRVLIALRYICQEAACVHNVGYC
jgi:hypothetical protein